NRGTIAYHRYYRLDGRERLVKQWDNLGAASESTPDVALTYQDATDTKPAGYRSTSLLDPTGSKTRQRAYLLDGAGEDFVELKWIPQGWSTSVLKSRNAATGEVTTYRSPTLAPTADPLAQTYGALLSGAQQVGFARNSTFDFTQ